MNKQKKTDATKILDKNEHMSKPTGIHATNENLKSDKDVFGV